MMIECVAFRPEHAFAILEKNEEAGIAVPISQKDMVSAYMSPGSIAMTMLADDEPVACGGVINMAWHRGEAWLLTLHDFKIKRDAFKAIRAMFNVLSEMGGFVRVQAISYDSDRCTLFKHLRFELEGVMKKFGVNGETGYLYSRIFESGEKV